MNSLGIDLSLRSTGLCFIQNDDIHFKLVQPSEKIYNDEKLVIHITDEIINFIQSFDILPDVINIEGLSYGSISSNIDIISGNHWYLRCKLFQLYPEIEIKVVPVQSWRAPLFSKEQRKIMKDCNEELKIVKQESKKLKGDEKKKYLLTNESVILGSNVKHQTWLKLTEDVQNKIYEITTKKDIYDLTDSYFIATFKGKRV
jgi:hypothetical protein